MEKWRDLQGVSTRRMVGQMLGWDTWTTMHKLISLIKAPQEQRSRYHNLLYLRIVNEDRQVPLLATRARVPRSKGTALDEMQRRSRRDLGIPFITKNERRALKWSTQSFTARVLWVAKFRIGPSTSQKNANRQPHLPLLNGLQHPGGHTHVVFEVERMASTQLAGWQVVRSTVIDNIDLCSKWSRF